MNHNTWREVTNQLLFYQEPRCGLLPSPPDARDFRFSVFAAAQALPPAFSRLDEMPVVRDQGNLGTCVGFASWAIKEWQEAQQRKVPEGGLSPGFIYALCKTLDGIPERRGTYLRTAMKVLQKHGTCSERNFKYLQDITKDVNPEQPDPEDIKEAQQYRTKVYVQLQGIEEIKRAIVEQGPVLAGVFVTQSFLDARETIPMPSGRIYGGHAVCLCGYDGRGFLLMNSWGRDWGREGFSWLPYEFLTWKSDIGMPAFYEAWACVDLPFTLKRARQIILKIDSNVAYVDGERVLLDVPARILDRRTLVPVRFVAEKLGYLVNWQAETKTVELRRPD